MKALTPANVTWIVYSLTPLQHGDWANCICPLKRPWFRFSSWTCFRCEVGCSGSPHHIICHPAWAELSVKGNIWAETWGQGWWRSSHHSPPRTKKSHYSKSIIRVWMYSSLLSLSLSFPFIPPSSELRLDPLTVTLPLLLSLSSLCDLDLPPIEGKIVMDRACSHSTALTDLRVHSQCTAASTTHRINSPVMQLTENRLVHMQHRALTVQGRAQTLASDAAECIFTLLKWGGLKSVFNTDWHTHRDTHKEVRSVVPSTTPTTSHPSEHIHNGSSGREIKRAPSPDWSSTAAVIVPEPLNDQHLFLPSASISCSCTKRGSSATHLPRFLRFTHDWVRIEKSTEDKKKPTHWCWWTICPRPSLQNILLTGSKYGLKRVLFEGHIINYCRNISSVQANIFLVFVLGQSLLHTLLAGRWYDDSALEPAANCSWWGYD